MLKPDARDAHCAGAFCFFGKRPALRGTRIRAAVTAAQVFLAAPKRAFFSAPPVTAELLDQRGLISPIHPFHDPIMIKKRTLGRTGLNVSEICFGTMNLGWKTDEDTSFTLLDCYHGAGGSFIQADAPSLAADLPASTSFSEEIVGRWWRSRNIPRGDLILGTRIHLGRTTGRGRAFVNGIEAECRESLRRFQTRYLDIVVFEWHDSACLPIEGTLDVFDFVVRHGLTRYVAAANFPTWRVADVIGRAARRGHSRMEALQLDYSLMTRARFEPEALPLCAEGRLGFLARSPLAGGFLARTPSARDRLPDSRSRWLMEKFGNAYGDTALDALASVAARHGVAPATVALAWVLHNPVVSSAVVGVRTCAQLWDLVRAGRVELSGPDLEMLNRATAMEPVKMAAPAQKEPEAELVPAS